jgi:hypothetical protein
MTISELIINWTERERKQHANLIMECLEREHLLSDLKGKTEAYEEDLVKTFENLFSGLTYLRGSVNKASSQMENIYFRWTNPQGNA